MLVLMSDGVLETIDEVDLIEREKTLLSRISGSLEKPGDLIRRLSLAMSPRMIWLMISLDCLSAGESDEPLSNFCGLK